VSSSSNFAAERAITKGGRLGAALWNPPSTLVRASRESIVPAHPRRRRKSPAARYCGFAISSIADAFRWRAVGKCASQQLTEQNISLMRPELQVDTEQRQYFDPRLIGLRHIEQTARGAMAGERTTVAPT
jgi:hypothetical protein